MRQEVKIDWLKAFIFDYLSRRWSWHRIRVIPPRIGLGTCSKCFLDVSSTTRWALSDCMFKNIGVRVSRYINQLHFNICLKDLWKNCDELFSFLLIMEIVINRCLEKSYWILCEKWIIHIGMHNVCKKEWRRSMNKRWWSRGHISVIKPGIPVKFSLNIINTNYC
jgi:hypothetical protein